MELRYQRARADGHLDWSSGTSTFARCWDTAYDILRFHRGKKFRITERPHGDPGPLRTLREVPDYLGPQLKDAPERTVFDVTSEDDGYTLSFRTLERETGGDRVIEHARARVGTPYVFGGTDCSWLSEACYAPEIDEDWVHNAHAQHEMFKSRDGYAIIGRDKIRPGDLLWHHDDDHVSIFLDFADGGRVWDTEPHGVGGPAGWGYISPGVRVRPMRSGYYCDWEHVNGIGRVYAVNGRP